MHNSNQNLICLDIGNTSIHLGEYHDFKYLDSVKIETSLFLQKPEILFDFIDFELPISYCSVVPSAEKILLEKLKNNSNIHKLDAESCPVLPITYPEPSEIGSDRLANALAAYALCPENAVVIDIGTATTFDVISKDQGYCGGVIVPGPQGFLDFLHQNTALLPKISLSEINTNQDKAIGKSTKSAMLLGIKNGYCSMVNGILDSISLNYGDSFYNNFEVLLVGGSSDILSCLQHKIKPNLTLDGLAIAFIS